MDSEGYKYTLKNGMVVLGEPMTNVASAAFDFLLPCGASLLPKGCGGAGEVTTMSFDIATGDTRIVSREEVKAEGLRLEDAKVVVSGDTSQVDLPPHTKSGLIDAIGRLRHVEGYANVVLTGEDIIKLGKREMNSRAYCSNFNFKGADQQKKVGQLSGELLVRLNLLFQALALGEVLASRDEGDGHPVLVLHHVGHELDRVARWSQPAEGGT